VYTVSWVGGGAMSSGWCRGMRSFGMGGVKTLKQSNNECVVTEGLKMISSPWWMTAHWFFSRQWCVSVRPSFGAFEDGLYSGARCSSRAFAVDAHL